MALGQHRSCFLPVPAALPSTPPARCPGRTLLAQQGQCQPSPVSTAHPYGFLSIHPPPPCPYLSLPSPWRLTTPACLHPSLCQGFWARLRPSLRSPGSCSPVSSPWGESRGSLLFPDCHIHFPALPTCVLWGDPPQPPLATAPPALPGGKPASAPPKISWVSCLLPDPLPDPLPTPASHAEVCLVSHFLLSPAWQTGESLVLRPGGGDWVCRGRMGAPGIQDEDRSLDSLLNNIFGIVFLPNFLSKERKQSFMGNSSNSW